jgi:phosphodiesterase/alkaline phosphatase D-like protein
VNARRGGPRPVAPAKHSSGRHGHSTFATAAVHDALLRSARRTADPSVSVHVDVRGLEPGREYYYQFKAGPELSDVGRTKTAPAPGSPVPASASCQNYPAGCYTEAGSPGLQPA